MERPELEETNSTVVFKLQNIKDVHYETALSADYGLKGNRKTIVNMFFFGLFILIVGWINYINLSTAQKFNSALSTGVQKIIGARKTDISIQCIFETSITYLIAILLSLGIYYFIKNPFFNRMGIPLNNAYLNPFEFTGIFLLVIGIAWATSVIYYSITTWRINPFISNAHLKIGLVRRYLIIGQLALTVIFISVTLLVNRQLQFMQKSDLGAEFSKVVMLSGPTSFNGEEGYPGIDIPKITQFRNFRNALKNNHKFISATASYDPIGRESRFANVRYGVVGEETNPTEPFYRYNVDNEFVKTYQLRLLAGRELPLSEEQYRRFAIINEEGMNLLGFKSPEEAIGKLIRRGNTSLEVCGVIANYHHEGLQKKISPMVFEYDHPSEFGYYAVRINTQNMQEAIAELEDTWKRYYPRDPFNYFFLDSYYNQQYLSEERQSSFFTLLALVSLLISCLGLYGMIRFFITNKIKEVGIRKVNGAGILSVVYLLNRNIVVWLIIAITIAIPVSYFLMQKWLENFAYKTTLSWWIFALAGVLALGIALLTVSFQSWKAAVRNPIESLRYE